MFVDNDMLLITLFGFCRVGIMMICLRSATVGNYQILLCGDYNDLFTFSHFLYGDYNLVSYHFLHGWLLLHFAM